MKYIRTKDGIIDLDAKGISSYEIIDDEKAINEYGVESGFINIYYYDDRGMFTEYDDKGGRSMNSAFLKDILKQADTVEELCDEFVYIKGNRKIIYRTYDICPKYDYEYQDELYGAIWCKWGLKYVAKMNKEGEFELL